MYETDARTKSAWDQRYRSPRAWAHQLERIIGRLHSDLSRPIDHDQTETRAAVAMAMRGASGRREPVQPNLNKLTDAEFARYTKEEFGFESKLG